jgi:YegS/Rv2252/BmrU family lipid kinase
VLPTLFVINPHSGNGNLKRIIPLIQDRFNGAAIPFDIYVTKKPKDATEVARAMSAKFPIIVAVGGDGTINEVVNGMAPSNILGVLPTGSGNDFSKMLQLPRSMSDILEVITRQKFKSIDLGRITSINSNSQVTRQYFINSVGIGLDAKVAFEAQKLTALRGLARYIVAALKSIFSYKPPVAHLSFDGRESHGEHLLIAVGNGKSAGGGFYLTPDALLDDGLLDICWVTDISRLETLRIFPFVLKGKHGRFDKVSFGRTSKLSVKSEHDMPVHVDGEVIGVNQREVLIELNPKSFKVIAS